MQSDHHDLGPFQDLRVRLRGPEEHQSGNPPRRDLRPARPQRRRQDDAHQHHLRHRQSGRGHGHRRRPRHRPRLPHHPRDDRPGAAGADHRRLRHGLADGQLQPRAVRQGAQPGLHREGAEGPVAVGQEGRQDHHAFRRHEAARADRQGAGARAGRPLPRRADGRRRRRAAQGHVGSWCAACATPASPSS